MSACKRCAQAAVCRVPKELSRMGRVLVRLQSEHRESRLQGRLVGYTSQPQCLIQAGMVPGLQITV